MAKINAGLMELEETSYWLELIVALFESPDGVNELQKEASELTAILVTLIKNRKKRDTQASAARS